MNTLNAMLKTSYKIVKSFSEHNNHKPVSKYNYFHYEMFPNNLCVLFLIIIISYMSITTYHQMDGQSI